VDSKEYITNAKKTESVNYDEIISRLSSPRMVRCLHSVMGISTESGELLDAIKKHVYYGAQLDTTNLFEELGDLFWYMAILADELDFDFEKVMQKNIEKLKMRYGGAFDAQKANSRNLTRERGVLESK
jgi:NTP pyrophosphatase (non-canonical NTP hydrolase)